MPPHESLKDRSLLQDRSLLPDPQGSLFLLPGTLEFGVRLIDETLCRPPDGPAASCKVPFSHSMIRLRSIHLATFWAHPAGQEPSHVSPMRCQLFMRRCRRFKCFDVPSLGQCHNSKFRNSLSVMHRNEESCNDSPQPLGLWIGGLGTQYPRHLLRPEKLDTFVKHLYDIEIPGSDRCFLWPNGN